MTRINGILLSAGFSSRMQAFKPLQEKNGVPMIAQVARKMLQVCHTVTVVTGFRSQDVVRALAEFFPGTGSKPLDDRLLVVHNREFEKGMFTSLQTGLKNLPDTDWLLYHFVDQPALPEAFYRAFIAQIESGVQWIQPRFQGKKGHPILMHRSLFPLILNADADSNLRQVTKEREIKIKIWDCSFREILFDLDTREDLERWRTL